MKDKFVRCEYLLGDNALECLKNKRVALFGVGGVGGYTLEALVRTGVGNIDVFDSDTVDITNFNRQILAVDSELGNKKTDAAYHRAKAINKDVNIVKHDVFYLPETADSVDLSVYDYIVDAIDTVTAKIELIVRATNLNVPIISVMGTGNKLDATRLTVSDIYKTENCPLARVMRYELKKRGVRKLKTVWSPEIPAKITVDEDGKKHSPASAVFVPAAAGIIAAGEVIKDLI
ncbi:MAG: tRNA threonylcarbamoyladenosine dehydratase [Ruminococcaceae bacterium]|nr:tRNA threonylcarbamoyladenosine dehydratase [Oscillospiraceae bacterium]